jgi:large subunit ribosomal protein L4
MGRFEWSNVLLVTGDDNHRSDAVYKSASNVEGVTVLPVIGMNVYDILKHNNLVLTKSAVDGVLKRLG